ncbi:protein FAM162A [Anolis carolinensis]|uniref:Family with sequence similarity 162 member A n=1 Tax=Anolis carolinensis TaxID=28377 RepID=R4GBY3_ANOCA|nr:PREDICTED: protein FAM162A [Anolis carolinensis]|eukprot:XP_003227340.1 PREDICTED: protein FAM162A [Anolis carolinensis]
MSGSLVAAGKVVHILDKNLFSVLRVTKGSCYRVNRRLCSKPQEASVQTSKPAASGASFKVPGHKPTEREKRMLLWTGRYKKAEDIPESVSFEMIDSAKNKIRVQMSYLMIGLTIVGCIIMVISGKQAVGRHESLTSQNMEKKARWREEAAHSASAKP